MKSTVKRVGPAKSKRGVNRRARVFSPRSILAPLDFSELSEGSLEEAKGIARQFEGELHLLHVVEPVLTPVEYGIFPPEMEEINLQLVAESKSRLQAMQKKLNDDGVECTVEVQMGRPWQVITEFAKRKKCDLIVIATHGLTGPKHLFLGSTAERVVQHAPCSVLVVR